MQRFITHLVREEDGQTLVEYGLLVSLVALVVITTLTILGGRTKRVFETTGVNIHTTT